ncbi:MAG: hypothetical protein ACP5NV_03785 [Candidatus Woesearchaeota archaeon]
MKHRKILLKKTIGISIFLALFTVTYLSLSSAEPKLPTEFYGKITTYNFPASSGVVRVYSGATLCGSFSIVNGGYYGVLSCNGDDPQTISDEGGIDGESLVFRFNSDPVTTFGDTIFSTGQFKLVNITHPVLFCGDGFCDILENCASCETDCFSCNMTTNQTNSTGNSSGNGSSTGGTGGTGGSGGSGSSGGGGGGAGAGSSTSGGSAGPTEVGSYCSENWICGNWTECSVLGLQTRECTDNNYCGTYDNKPLEVEECDYMSCFDGLMNCHNNLCEEGIDCGGPCFNKCSFLEQQFQNSTIKIPRLEIPMQVCERKIDFKNKGLWIFIAFIIVAMAGRYLYSEYRVKKLRINEDLSPLDKSRKILSSKRKTQLFILTLLFLALASLLYSYYFLLCPTDFFNYSWILLLLLILIPLVIHTIMRKYEYSESIHMTKQKKMEDTHYQSIVNMINIENNIISEEENSVALKLYDLSNQEEFKEIIEKHPQIKKIYKNLVDLYNKYQEKKNPFNMEKDLCDEINELSIDEDFKSEISKIPELKNIFERLQGIYKQYEEKQKLYDQLDKAEKEVREEKSDKK